MAAPDLTTATPAIIRERVGELWSLGEVQAALAARRLPPLYAANDAEIERAFTAERLPIGQAMAWIVYRDRRLAYVAAIALEETRQAITSSTLATAGDMKMSWREALQEMWDRLSSNVGVTAYDGETSDSVIPADKWPRLRFMVCKDVGYGRSARAVGYPWPRDAGRPLHESAGTELVHCDVWVSRSDVLREWPPTEHVDEQSVVDVAAESLARLKSAQSEGGKKGRLKDQEATARWKAVALQRAQARRGRSGADTQAKMADAIIRGWRSEDGPPPGRDTLIKAIASWIRAGELKKRNESD